MATIFYSVAGEGRGHATRVRAVVSALSPEHDVRVFASGAAYDLLSSVSFRQRVVMERIPGLFFQYSGTQMSWSKTMLGGAAYLTRLNSLVSRMESRIRSERPHLVITDFEPALPRAALRCGIPFISLDHQHFLVVNDLRSLPASTRWKAWSLSHFVKLWYSGQNETIVSSFYSPPLKDGYENTIQVGVLLRPEILQARPEPCGHLLVYLRRSAGDGVLEALMQTGRPVHVYGLGELPSVGNLRFFAVAEDAFVEDLVTCNALICSAGNQLIGEAQFLGKPVLAIPETKNFEQSINAHFLQESGIGETLEAHQVTPETLNRFLDRLDEYRCLAGPDEIAGNRQVMSIIQDYLPATAQMSESTCVAAKAS